MFPSISGPHSGPSAALLPALASMQIISAWSILPPAEADETLLVLMPIILAARVWASHPVTTRVGRVISAIPPRLMALHSRYSAYFASLANGGLAVVGGLASGVLALH